MGCIAMVLGTLDPMEASLVLLPGCGSIALGMFLGANDHRTVLYWTWAFLLTAVGVAALIPTPTNPSQQVA